MTWAERVNAAWESWHRWSYLPGRFRMDRVLKDARVRDLIVERDGLRADLVCRQQKINALLDALDRMTTDERDDPCWRDHHGYCQAHWLEEDCSMAHARTLLAAMRDSAPSARNES